ncbi:SDR family NAD(P)-dependent oxidoreductase [Paraburkholderia tropica]|uniref:3-oxoacyl-[acyl-carrier protein] reductase n=1 Tax=Paraburkholderia tropica TaxID=92647 RepID=A0A1A5XJ24_9BURK|nr:SDR family NAD(P)-dependent oxidoreductase [Paraburkholderia tropica]MBB2979878.1 3-oxoacyl-[acyl-carrier protein] reductase [Paraburkholderia tropica]OBR53339.1 oxidoreductase [Paraburkholderia tropica]PXX16857.1 3-oxoacyl-[acyl-carrier protein] reductase [Paraburkholderia tropica]PZW84000.1 3-oxoacyl-[acyl-carrier protein] reductase [Paraburkholderia tropica]RQN39287.1 SDR family oxidoreductase [Paraburkholderia tropica]
MAKQLDGKVALVTGGAQGIGRAIVKKFIDEGSAVGILDRDLEKAQEAAEAIMAQGGQALAFGGDVAKRETIFNAAEALAEQAGRLDVVVSNAMWVRYAPVLEISERDVSMMTGTGFNSVVWGIQAAAQYMKEGGSVVNIASASGFIGLPRALVYCGVKAGVLGLMRSAAAELGARGIRINSVAPGYTETEGVAKNVSEETRKVRLAKTPMPRLGKPEDIANAACFLASDQSSFVNGECIRVDGGSAIAYL